MVLLKKGQKGKLNHVVNVDSKLNTNRRFITFPHKIKFAFSTKCIRLLKFFATTFLKSTLQWLHRLQI